jgi:hypothetical protein
MALFLFLRCKTATAERMEASLASMHFRVAEPRSARTASRQRII